MAISRCVYYHHYKLFTTYDTGYLTGQRLSLTINVHKKLAFVVMFQVYALLYTQKTPNYTLPATKKPLK